MSKQKPSGNEKPVKVEVELPALWVKFIEFHQEWNGEPVDVAGAIRNSLRCTMEADLSDFSGNPLDEF